MILKIWFSLKTFFIIVYHFLIYSYTCDYNRFIISLARSLSKENIFYGKMIQAISSNTVLMNDELIERLLYFTNNVDFDKNDIDIEVIESLNEYSKKRGYDIQNLNYLTPINSGLISLVYLVKLNDKYVIVKLKRKNIYKLFNDAFENISVLIKMFDYMKYTNNLNIHKIFNENKKLLLEQLDFENEVENIKLFNKKYKNVDYIVIPEVYEEFTLMNNNLIVMEYIEGKNISQLTLVEKEIYSTQLINFGLKCFLIDGIYHADLHPGNIIFIQDTNSCYKIGIIDFGLVGKLSREEQEIFYLFVSKLLLNEYDNCIQYIFCLMIEIHNKEFKKEINYNISDKNFSNELKTILKNIIEINKKFTLTDVVRLNNLLKKYNLQLKTTFCNLQLAMAVCESTNNSLCIKKTFMVSLKEQAEKVYSLFNS